MIPKKCPNLERNREECPCEYDDCPRKGFCCECIRYHHAMGELTACEKKNLTCVEPVAPAGDEARPVDEARPEEAPPFRLTNYAACAG